MSRGTHRHARALAVALCATACHATEALPVPPRFEADEQSAVLFVEPTPGDAVAYAWDADALSPGDLPGFTGDSAEPRLYWVTFACPLEALGLDGPLELGDGPAEVPTPVRQLQMVDRSWTPASDVALLDRLPIRRPDFCRAQASAVTLTSARLVPGGPTPPRQPAQSWTAAIDGSTVLYVQTSEDDDDPNDGTSDAFVATLSLLRDIAASRASPEAAHAPALTSGPVVTGAFSVRDEDDEPTGDVLWLEPGLARWLEIDASGEATERARWAHSALRGADQIEVSVRQIGPSLDALILVGSWRSQDRYVSTLLSLREGELTTSIPTATVSSNIPLELVELTGGDALVRGSAPGLVEGDRLLRVSGGEIVDAAVERLPAGSATCPIRQVLGADGVDLYVGAGPGCRSDWSVRVVEDGVATWRPAPRAPELATASARRAGGVLSAAGGALLETRAEVGRCPIATEVDANARSGSWAPASTPDTWVLFAAAEGGVDVQLWDVAERAPRCEAR